MMLPAFIVVLTVAVFCNANFEDHRRLLSVHESLSSVDEENWYENDDMLMEWVATLSDEDRAFYLKLAGAIKSFYASDDHYNAETDVSELDTDTDTGLTSSNSNTDNQLYFSHILIWGEPKIKFKLVSDHFGTPEVTSADQVEVTETGDFEHGALNGGHLPYINVKLHSERLKTESNAEWFKLRFGDYGPLKAENIWSARKGTDNDGNETCLLDSSCGVQPKELNFAVFGQLSVINVLDGVDKEYDLGYVTIGQGSYPVLFGNEMDWWIGSPNMRNGVIKATTGECVQFNREMGDKTVIFTAAEEGSDVWEGSTDVCNDIPANVYS